jgi:hypothetical protein
VRAAKFVGEEASELSYSVILGSAIRYRGAGQQGGEVRLEREIGEAAGVNQFSVAIVKLIAEHAVAVAGLGDNNGEGGRDGRTADRGRQRLWLLQHWVLRRAAASDASRSIRLIVAGAASATAAIAAPSARTPAQYQCFLSDANDDMNEPGIRPTGAQCGRRPVKDGVSSLLNKACCPARPSGQFTNKWP